MDTCAVAHARDRYKVCTGNQKERGDLIDISLDGRVILK